MIAEPMARNGLRQDILCPRGIDCVQWHSGANERIVYANYALEDGSVFFTNKLSA